MSIIEVSGLMKYKDADGNIHVLYPVTANDICGELKWFIGKDTNFDKWLLCDGSAVSRTIYSDLFAIIGTTYGEGDGSTTFNLPNVVDKVAGMVGKLFIHI